MKGAPGALRIALVARAKSSEILGCPRHHVRKQLNDNPSFHVSTDADVHEHSRIWLRRDYYIHSSIRFFSIIDAQILHRFHGHVDPRRTRTDRKEQLQSSSLKSTFQFYGGSISPHVGRI